MKFLDARPNDLVEVLRRARVEDRSIALRAPRGSDASVVRLIAGKDATVAFDAHNDLADVDGALTLSSVARRLEKVGAVFPIARPLPPLSIAAACAALPYFVEAYVQQASALTFNGDAWESPRAPRAAAGPSLLASLCARPPLALVVRARLRAPSASRVVMLKEEHADIPALARRVRDLVEDGRAFSLDACGNTLLILAGTTAAPKSAVPSTFTHEGRGRGASFARSESLVPGDLDAMIDALSRGARVVAAPFMGRVASLWRGFAAIPVVEVDQGARFLADALISGSTAGSKERGRGRP